MMVTLTEEDKDLVIEELNKRLGMINLYTGDYNLIRNNKELIVEYKNKKRILMNLVFSNEGDDFNLKSMEALELLGIDEYVYKSLARVEYAVKMLEEKTKDGEK